MIVGRNDGDGAQHPIASLNACSQTWRVMTSHFNVSFPFFCNNHVKEVMCLLGIGPYGIR